MKITLEQWRMFRAVAENGGFNQAASVVYKSASSIYQSIQKIEAQLGVELFETEGRKVSLTPSGKVILRRAVHILDEAKKIESISLGLKNSPKETLSIAIDQVTPRTLVNGLMHALNETRPNIDLEIFETTLSGTSELLVASKVDLAIGGFPVVDRYFEPLCKVEFVAVAATEHPLSGVSELAIEDLVGHRQIVVRDSHSSEELDHGWVGAEHRWSVSNISTSIKLIKAGLGYAWLPKELVQADFDNHSLLALPISSMASKSIELGLMFTSEACLSDSAKLAREILHSLQGKT
ncbi:LysR family transcriptional regulator [Paraferrimonas sp. SM1919]|uniref:LysR family transcriptional regulator n=1 Tax=Paraferrimonas sp. SM1919 TaxID=2662263 RepID=UPI0013D3618F|nr:LysR family transcriptional regulator [Paraferrimonas sp. SM1919]